MHVVMSVGQEGSAEAPSEDEFKNLRYPRCNDQTNKSTYEITIVYYRTHSSTVLEECILR